jgi:hypothetical protein
MAAEVLNALMIDTAAVEYSAPKKRPCVITTKLYRRVGELSAVITEVSQARLKNGDVPKSPSLSHRQR